jgi:hypothetical protein
VEELAVVVTGAVGAVEVAGVAGVNVGVGDVVIDGAFVVDVVLEVVVDDVDVDVDVVVEVVDDVVVVVVVDGVTTTPKSKVKSASPLLGRFTDVAVSVDESTSRSEPALAVVA